MFKLVNGGEFLPEAQTKYSAGYDVRVSKDTVVPCNEPTVLTLGVGLDLTDHFLIVNRNVFFDLRVRSSLSKKGLILLNGAGVIDVDYLGEICMLTQSVSPHPLVLKKGTRVGQILILRHSGFELLGTSLRKTEDRDGGFGSTGETK